MKVEPICSSPVDGSMETASGFRLCCNPLHAIASRIPVWHPIAEWNTPKKAKEYSYDQDCEDLARGFLEDDGTLTDERLKELAQTIQDAIENWLGPK